MLENQSFRRGILVPGEAFLVPGGASLKTFNIQHLHDG